jgi:hypothetical protein
LSLWSYDELKLARGMNRRGDFPGTIARATGHTRAEVDLALWHLLGRSFEEACDAINLAQIEHHAIIQGQGQEGANNVLLLVR